MTQQKYSQPGWAAAFQQFWRKFCISCRALFDIFRDITGSLAMGVAYVMKTIFNVFGKFLNPVAVATTLMCGAAGVIMWGLWSWIWVGVTLLGILGVPAWLAGFIGLIVGVLLNLVEIMPELGKLFREYADVLGRSGKFKAADGADRLAITSSNFLDFSIYTLKKARNMGLITEGVLAMIYQWTIGGFTATKVVKGVAITSLKGFWPVIGSAAWVIALVKLPELTLKMACAAIHVAANLHPDAYAED